MKDLDTLFERETPNHIRLYQSKYEHPFLLYRQPTKEVGSVLTIPFFFSHETSFVKVTQNKIEKLKDKHASHLFRKQKNEVRDKDQKKPSTPRIQTFDKKKPEKSW